MISISDIKNSEITFGNENEKFFFAPINGCHMTFIVRTVQPV